MPRLCLPDYTVVRDTREKVGHGWMFEASAVDRPSPRCLGTVVETLATGDYSAKGYEDILAIERKEDFSEVWNNYGEKDRFEAEMERMAGIRHSFILIESHLTPDILKLSPPQFRAGVPGKALTSWLLNLILRYGVHIIPVGSSGQRIAKQIIENVVRLERDRWVMRDVRRNKSET